MTLSITPFKLMFCWGSICWGSCCHLECLSLHYQYPILILVVKAGIGKPNYNYYQKIFDQLVPKHKDHHLSPSLILDSMLTLSIMTQSIMPISISDSHHDDTQTIVVLSVAMLRVVIPLGLSVTLLSTSYYNICGLG